MADRTRRAFLAQSAVAVPLAASALPAGAAVDPIHAAIAAHRKAYGAFVAEIDRGAELAATIPNGQREEDPRWIAHEERIDETSERADVVAWALVKVCPTSPEGLQALLAYVVECERADPELFPDDIPDERKPRAMRGHTFGWSVFLHQMLADALPAILGKAEGRADA